MKSFNQVSHFLAGKSPHTLALFYHFINEFEKIGDITIGPTKTMIGISNPNRRIAWVSQLGRNFIHVVLPFRKAYPDNLCFQKIGALPSQLQINHHLRILNIEDINGEVLKFMQIAYNEEK